jgi:Tfp pilus assembly protein FimT
MKRQRRQHVSLSNVVERQRQTRRGSSLPQMVITITIMSVLMTLVSTALFRMYRQEMLMVERTFQTSTWLRLQRDFCRDLHVASSVEQSDDGHRLTLTDSEVSIVWLIDGDDVKRQIRDSDSEDDPSSLSGEQYSFEDSAIRFSVETSATGRTIAAVEVTPPLTPNGGTSAANVVIATAGLDHRFLRQGDLSGEQP